MDSYYKKVRYYFWFIQAILYRHYKAILASFVIGIIGVIVFAKFSPLVWGNIKHTNKTIGLVGSYTPVNLPYSLQRMISTGLTDVAISGEVLPAIAKDWDISKDGKEYTFHLRSDLTWHDGTHFVASDINYNLRDVTFTAADDKTLVVKLKDAFSPLPNFLSKPLFKQGLVGLGSYKISGIKLKGENVSYLKLEPLTPDLPILEIKFYATESIAKTAFKLGEVNALDDIVDPDPLNSWQVLTIVENPNYNQYVGLFFNLSDSLLKEKDVRQALAFAFEKPEKNRIVTPLSLKSWAYTTRVKQYDLDFAKAKKTITDKKIASDSAIVISTFQQHLPLAQKIADGWQKLGITTKLKVENDIPQNYQVLLATEEIPSDPDQYAFWHSTQNATNITQYVNPKIDKLLEDGRKETDIEKRKKIYFDFQRYLVDDVPAVFLYHPVTYTISK